MKPKHPMQPLVVEQCGVHRFLENKIVRFLLDAGPFDMNMLAFMPFDREDHIQFAQLIGYSVNTFCDLPYVDDEHAELATDASAALIRDLKNAHEAKERGG